MYKTFNWLLFIAAIILLAACKTTKQTPEEKAYEERATRIRLLADARKMFPCDTVKSEIVKVDTAFIWHIHRDTIIISESGDSVHYIDRYRTIEKVVTKIQTVIDEAALQAARDSIDNRGFLLDAAIKANADCENDTTALKAQISRLNTYKGIIIGMSVLLAFCGVYVAYRIIKKTYS
jgi:hypothetical protein